MAEVRPSVHIYNKAKIRSIAISLGVGLVLGAAAFLLWGGGGKAQETIDELRATNAELQQHLAAAEADSERLEIILGDLSGIADSLEAANQEAADGVSDSLHHLVVLERVLVQLEAALRDAGLLDQPTPTADSG
jgi:hypothetical protein